VIRRALAGLALLLLAPRAWAAPPTINCPPVQSTYENFGISFAVSASDPDGDPVTLSIVNPPQRSDFDPSSGQFTWVPSFAQAGSYNVQFQATAGGQTTSCTVPITIENFDRAPVFKCPAPATAVVGDTVKAQLVATDPDAGDVLVFSSTNLPPGATLTPQGKFTWPTAAAALGTRVVPFTVNDGTVSASCSFSVTLTAAPLQIQIFCPPSVQVQETSVVDFSVSGVSPSARTLVLTCLNPPAGATVTGGHLRWTPDFSQQGIYDVAFRATNGFDLPAECTVRITVLDLDPSQPVFDTCPGPNLTSPEGVLVAFGLTASDPANAPLTYTVQNLPAGATFDANARQFSWIPSFTQAGVYDVTFKADNGAKFALCAVHFQITDRLPAGRSSTVPGPSRSPSASISPST
jgi:hypothetical protein